MPNNNKQITKKRQYPPFWEKFIPAALVIILAVIIILIIVIISVALGVIPGLADNTIGLIN